MPLRVRIPNCILISSAVSAALTIVTDRPTDRQTDNTTLSVTIGAPTYVPYFPDYKPRLFFKNFRVAAYITVRLMCGHFQKTTHYTLHATACLDQHLITISSPTVLHNHWLFLQPCSHPSPTGRVSLSLCLCMRGRGCLLHAPAEHGKTPARCPVLSMQLWPPDARQTLTHTHHTIDPLRGAHSRCLGLASNYCITADFRPHY